MGLLDGLYSSPESQAQLALAAGLLGAAPRTAPIGRAFMGSMGAYNDAQQSMDARALRQMQLRKLQQQEAEQARINGIFSNPDNYTSRKPVPSFAPNDDEGNPMPVAQGPAQFDSEKLRLSMVQSGIPSLIKEVADEDRKRKDGSLFGKLDPSDFTPESLAKFQVTGNYGDLVLNPRNAKMPTAIQAVTWLNDPQRTEQEKQQYWDSLRGVQTKEIAGVKHQFVPGKGWVPLSDLQSEVDAQRALAGSKEEGKDTGAALVKWRDTLATMETSAPFVRQNIKELLAHPGLDWTTGWPGRIPEEMQTPMQKAFMARHNQLEGEVFLQARQQLKGGGAITDFEGKKAEQAYARLSRAQTSAEYKAAVQEFLRYYEAGMEKLRKQIQGAEGALAPRPRTGGQQQSAPRNGSGIKFLGFE